jgi:hypothetical protein
LISLDPDAGAGGARNPAIEDFDEHLSRDGDLGDLEGRVAAMTHHLRADL